MKWVVPGLNIATEKKSSFFATLKGILIIVGSSACIACLVLIGFSMKKAGSLPKVFRRLRMLMWWEKEPVTRLEESTTNEVYVPPSEKAIPQIITKPTKLVAIIPEQSTAAELELEKQKALLLTKEPLKSIKTKGAMGEQELIKSAYLKPVKTVQDLEVLYYALHNLTNNIWVTKERPNRQQAIKCVDSKKFIKAVLPKNIFNL